MDTIHAKIIEESMGVWEYGSMGVWGNYQLSISSVIGHRSSVIGQRSSVIGHRSSVIGHLLWQMDVFVKLK